jgi:hypothetical protein
MIGPNNYVSTPWAQIIGKVVNPYKSSGISWAYVICLLLIMFGAGGYFFYRAKNGQKASSTNIKKVQNYTVQRENSINESLDDV